MFCKLRTTYCLTKHLRLP